MIPIIQLACCAGQRGPRSCFDVSRTQLRQVTIKPPGSLPPRGEDLQVSASEEEGLTRLPIDVDAMASDDGAENDDDDSTGADPNAALKMKKKKGGKKKKKN